MERNFLDFLDKNMEHRKLDELDLKPFGFERCHQKIKRWGCCSVVGQSSSRLKVCLSKDIHNFISDCGITTKYKEDK